MAAQRHTGIGFTTLTTRNRFSAGSWVNLTFGRRWNGTQWIELWGDNEGNPAVIGGGAFFVFNDDEATVAFTENSSVDTLGLTNSIQGF